MAALDPVFGHTAAACLGAVLLLGAADKLRERAVFRDAVEGYALLPLALVPAFALALALTEALAGALLLPAATRPLGAALAALLLALVSAAVAVNLARGRAGIDCGCGGASQRLPIGRGLLARNAVLLGLAAVAAWPVAARATVWLDLAAVGFATLFLLGLYLVANTLLGQHGRLLELRNAP